MTTTDVPQSMMAVSYAGAGGRETVQVVSREVPVPAAGEVLVKVAAAGINNADLMQRAGIYPPPPGVSDVPGLEVSGTVAGLGAGVADWSLGDDVCALLAGGGYAEYVAVPAGQAVPVPEGVSLVQAAGFPEVAATCWANLVMHARVVSGDRVLVHGGAGGIGSFAVQLLKGLGAEVLTTVGSPDKVKLAQDLGADVVINHKEQDFVEEVETATGGAGVDVILDVVGGKYLDHNLDALAAGGRQVTIGLLGGLEGTLNLAKVMAKQAWITGTTIRARPVEEKSKIMDQVRQQVWPMITEGTIQPLDTRSFPLEQAADAQDWFTNSDRAGKLLLVTSSSTAQSR